MSDTSSSRAPLWVRMRRALSRGAKPTGWQPEPGTPVSLARPRCATCGAEAVMIELSERSGGWHLRYEGAAGGNGRGDPISAERAQAILDALRPPYELARIQAAGFYDDLGYCASCATFYCPIHWQVSSTAAGHVPRATSRASTRIGARTGTSFDDLRRQTARCDDLRAAG